MSLVSDTSEYAGIRIAMHDALQRYYASGAAALPDNEKLETLQQTIRRSCAENAYLVRAIRS